MRPIYDYDKRLNFTPAYNLWQHNFERWPYKSQLRKVIQTVKDQVLSFEPDADITLKKYQYPSDRAMPDFYKISPKGLEDASLPVILYIHGGGFICPLDIMMLNNGSFYAKTLKCHVLLPEYRLAPDYSDREIMEDCFQMLRFAYQNAESLALDLSNLIIFGDSAGGALAAGLTLLARDKGLPMAKGQMLIYPVVDYHLEGYPSMNLKYAEWNKAASKHMWHLVFKKGKHVPEYIAPITNANHQNLPPAYIEVQEFDSLKDPAIAYGEKLKAAGVPVTLRMIQGTYHGFDNQIQNPFVLEVLLDRCKVMSAFLH